jgi:CubicO group peptidase (beta-lactamase class C family)
MKAEKIKLLVAIISLVSIYGFGQNKVESSYHVLDSTITSWVQSGKLVSAELLITDKGIIDFNKAYGATELNSLWQIKSMTKPITATLILQLEEEGKLSLDDPVTKYLPEFAGDKRVTIKNLLNHTSGYKDQMDWKKHPGTNLKDWITNWAKEKPNATYNEYAYSDFNFGLLGYIITVITDEKLAAYTEKKILNPLGMKESYTWFTPDSTWASRVQTRNYWDTGKQTNIPYWTNKEEHQWPFYTGYGGIYCTARDYAKFMQSWLDNPYEKALKINEPNGDGYGYGWRISGPVFYHTGYDGTMALAFPSGKTLIFMTHSLGNTHYYELLYLLSNFE